MVKTERPERRASPRIRLAEPLVARFGSSAVLVLDISASGARLEHYSRIERGTVRPLRLQWNAEELGIKARVVASRVDRFVPGDQGLTVYRSGVAFIDEMSAEIERIAEIVSNLRAQTLVEQVANARGFYTPDKEEMPIFRDGVLTTNAPQLEGQLSKLLPSNELVRQSGFVRWTLKGSRWISKWTLNREQPEDGFTISASEPKEEVQMLCDAYENSDEEGRELIRQMASATIDD